MVRCGLFVLCDLALYGIVSYGFVLRCSVSRGTVLPCVEVYVLVAGCQVFGCIALQGTVLCGTVLCICLTVLYGIVLCCIGLYGSMGLKSIVLCCVVWFCMVSYCVVLYLFVRVLPCIVFVFFCVCVFFW